MIEIDSFDDLPEGLIKARIAAGLSQKDLGERLNLKEQQIQRYEADRYASASFQRMQEVAKAIGVGIRKGILLSLTPNKFDSLVTKLGQAGLDKDFLKAKILPTTELANLDGTAGACDEEKLVAHTADIASHVFGWSAEELFAPPPLTSPRYAAAAARFKLPAGRRSQSHLALCSICEFIFQWLSQALVKNYHASPSPLTLTSLGARLRLGMKS